MAYKYLHPPYNVDARRTGILISFSSNDLQYDCSIFLTCQAVKSDGHSTSSVILHML